MFQLGELRKTDLVIILSIVSNIMRMYGLLLIVPLILSIALKDYAYSSLFFYMALPIVVISFVLRRFLKPEEGTLKHSVIALVLGWIAIPLISAIPFIFLKLGVLNSIFESFSGWTGTGLTMIKDPSLLPMTMGLYRGLIQWIGGFGIVILALLVYERPKTAHKLFEAEGRTEDFYVNVVKISRMIVGIYIIYTIIGIILMKLSGVPWYDAIVNIMTAVSTGGFSTTAKGVGSFGILPMSIVTMMMLIGGISFISHYELFKGKIKAFFRDPSIRFMFLIIFISFIFVSFEVFYSKKGSITDGLIYVVSALTGSGHTGLNPLTSFAGVSLLFIILLMMSGACYGSTTGALKIWRTMIIIKVIRREVKKVFLPERAVIPIKVGDVIVSDENALKAASYMLLYIAVLIMGAGIFMFAGYSTIDSIFTVSSAQGNVGLNILTENYFNMNPFLKIQLILHMFLGRMEIIPMLIFLRSFFSVRRA